MISLNKFSFILFTISKISIPKYKE